MDGANSFTLTDFVRLQQRVAHLQKLNKDLEARLALWQPDIAVEARESEIPGVVYTVKYGKDGLRLEFDAKTLAEMTPEMLADVVHSVATQTADVKIKTIKEVIQPAFQRAADYSKTATKGQS